MADAGLMTIRELLADEEYKKYFMTIPHLPEHYTKDAQPWRLLVQLTGDPKWKSQRFGTYKEAYIKLKKLMPKVNNAAINSPGLGFMPPVRTVRVKGKVHDTGKLKGQPVLRTLVWKPQLTADMAQHHWCAHCRRPTIFADKGMPTRMLNGTRLPATRVAYRCTLCGTNAELMDIRKPELNQRWDVARPKVYELASA